MRSRGAERPAWTFLLCPDGAAKRSDPAWEYRQPDGSVSTFPEWIAGWPRGPDDRARYDPGIDPNAWSWRSRMRKPIETLAGGLGHPEGPDILPDGRIVMVETYTSRIVAWSAERGIHDYALCGGGPNACMLGSDGALYITQNGGTVGAWRADVMSVPSIQKAWPDGRVAILATEVAGIPLQAPNDLTFGRDGRLYFTDPADYLPNDRRPGRVFALDPDGTGEVLAELPSAYPNGIVAEPDGSIVWVESYDRGVYRIPPGGVSERIHQLPE